MSLRDELPPPGKAGGRCSVPTFIASQPNPDEWEALFADPSVGSVQLFHLARRYGWPNSHAPIQRHRAGGCACGVA